MCGGGRALGNRLRETRAEASPGTAEARFWEIAPNEEQGLFRTETLPSECVTRKSLESVASPFSARWFRWKPNS